MKKQKKHVKKSKSEREYLTVFSPKISQGAYSDEDSLEQPSALKYVPSTATPRVEGYDPK